MSKKMLPKKRKSNGTFVPELKECWVRLHDIKKSRNADIVQRPPSVPSESFCLPINENNCTALPKLPSPPVPPPLPPPPPPAPPMNRKSQMPSSKVAVPQTVYFDSKLSN